MKNFTIALSVLVFLTAGCSDFDREVPEPKQDARAAERELHETLVELDRVYFEAYNTCDLETQAKMYADDLEFYHDEGGLTTSKAEVIEGIKKNICGKVTRELVEGSLEVYPIEGHGAVMIGLHRFHNHEEKDAGPSEAVKFIVIWKHEKDLWKMTRVISLHSKPG